MSETHHVYSSADRRVYGELRHEMEATSHGGLFSIREMQDDPLGLLSLDNAYVPPKPFDAERFEWLKTNVLWPFIIARDAYDGLVEGMDETLRRDDVVEHLDSDQNGSLAWASNHISYADIAILMAARTDVNIRRGDTNPTERHVAVASRLISLFRLDLLDPDMQPAYVVDDGLLSLGGYLQTVPASASGSRVRHLVGHDVNAPVKGAYHRLLNRGSEFLIAPSGTQDKVVGDPPHLVMDTVSRGTVGLLTEPNEIEGASRLLTVPVFIDCNPFTDGKFTGEPVAATHHFLEPRYLRDGDDVTDMMTEIAYEGTVHKRPGTLPIAYKKPTILDKTVGQVGTAGEVYKT